MNLKVLTNVILKVLDYLDASKLQKDLFALNISFNISVLIDFYGHLTLSFTLN